MILALSLAACAPDVPSLRLAAFQTPREAYAEILPAFSAREGRAIAFEESYQASGAQSRAVVGGFEADVVALSLAPDITRLQEAGLVTSDWTAGPHGGMVTESLVVIAVRAGNPHGLRDWADLARPGLQVLTPNVRTSGGAMWNVAALWGATARQADESAATDLLAKVLANVSVMDKGGRESLLSFERGVGDAAITYENEVLASQAAGHALEYIVPSSTLVVENPVAVVDVYTDQHGTTEVARRLVSFLHEPEAQALFAAHGFRRVDGLGADGLPQPADRFTIRDLGGWPSVTEKLFANGAIYDQATRRVEP